MIVYGNTFGVIRRAVATVCFADSTAAVNVSQICVEILSVILNSVYKQNKISFFIFGRSKPLPYDVVGC